MNTRKSPLFALALAAISLAGVGAAGSAIAQSTADDTELLLTQIQTDKRAVVLKSMQLDDAQMADKIGHDWMNPETYYEKDGSVADW